MSDDAALAAQIGKQLLSRNEELTELNSNLQKEILKLETRNNEQSTIVERLEGYCYYCCCCL
jgi:hypothetical protein